MVTNPPLEWRRAGPGDRPFLLALRRQTMSGYLAAVGLAMNEQQHRQRVDYRFDCCHLLMSGEQRVGMVKFELGEGRLELMQLQVLPDWQGRGLGTKVIKGLVALAGARPIVLSVLKSNPAARLYHRLGFESVGEDAHEYFMRRPAGDGEL